MHPAMPSVESVSNLTDLECFCQGLAFRINLQVWDLVFDDAHSLFVDIIPFTDNVIHLPLRSVYLLFCNEENMCIFIYLDSF